MIGEPETRRLVRLVNKLSTHARAVIDDHGKAQEAVRKALSGNPRKPGTAIDEPSFLANILQTISRLAREHSGAEDRRDREAVSLHSLFDLCSERIANIMGETSDMVAKRMERAPPLGIGRDHPPVLR